MLAAARALTGAVDAGLTGDTTQLGLHYRWSVLANAEYGERDATRAGGVLQPSDRAPDARCRTLDGLEARLFDIFRGPHFTLLSFGPHTAPRACAIAATHGVGVRACVVLEARSSDESGAAATLVDARGEAARCYGASSGMFVLVRPDGYVAAIDRGGKPRNVAHWLRAL